MLAKARQIAFCVTICGKFSVAKPIKNNYWEYIPN